MVQLGDCDVFYQVEITWKNTRHVQIVGNQVGVTAINQYQQDLFFRMFILNEFDLLKDLRFVILRLCNHIIMFCSSVSDLRYG